MQAPDGAVIVYHAIGSVSRSAPHRNAFVRPERFAAQMAYLTERRRVVDLDTLFEADSSNGPPRVAITFDDGYRDAIEHAVPLLQELGLPATFFVPTRWIGAESGWDPFPLKLISRDDLVGLARSGFTIGSHGHAHIDYAHCEPRGVEADVRASVEQLAALLGSRPRYLAYPYGRATPEAAREAARLGIRGAFALDRPQPLSGALAVPRVSIVPSDGTSLFALKTAGRYIGWRHSAPVRAVYGAVRPLVRNRWLWP